MNRFKYLPVPLAVLALVFMSFAGPAAAQLNAVQTWGGTAGGTSTALTVPINNVVGLGDLLGIPIRLLPNGVNNGPATLAIVLDSGGTLGPIAIKKLSPSGMAALTGCELKTGQESTLVYDGTEFAITSNTGSINPTYTHLTGGTGTFVPPTCATGLEVRLKAGGGGGGGGGTAGNSGNVGTGGVITSFGGLTVNPGQPGAGGGGTTGIGGAGGSSGSGSAVERYPGGAGGAGSAFNAGTGAFGGSGASGCDGGAGLTTTTNGGNGGLNSGAGAAGGSSATAGSIGGGGGGAGECALFSLTQPLASSYSYAVGTGGPGGSGGLGAQGGTGADGDILIKVLYNFLLRRDLDPAANDNSPMWLNRAA